MRPNKLLYVDAMRGWAILMVIICHQAQAFSHLFAPVKLLASYCQTGVPLFFITSAYTLSNSARQRHEEKNPARNFFIRRVFRIAPLYYVAIVIYFMLAHLFPLIMNSPDNYTWLNMLTNAAFIHGFFPSAFNSVVPGGWSIGTEFAFYALFPVLFPLFERMNSMFGWKVLVIPVIFFATASATLLANTSMNDQIYWFWYDFILNNIPIFMIGMILFLATQDDYFQPAPARDWPAFLVTTAVGVWLLANNLFILLPLISALSFVFLFNILRAASHSYGLIEKIGRASYSMYIFHFIFAIYATRLFMAELPDIGVWENAAFPAALIITIAATYFVGRMSEHLIEHRFIEYGRRLTH